MVWVQAYWLRVTLGEKKEVVPQKPVDWEFDDLQQQPDTLSESSSLSPGKETSLPR